MTNNNLTRVMLQDSERKKILISIGYLTINHFDKFSNSCYNHSTCLATHSVIRRKLIRKSTKKKLLKFLDQYFFWKDIKLLSDLDLATELNMIEEIIEPENNFIQKIIESEHHNSKSDHKRNRVWLQTH